MSKKIISLALALIMALGMFSIPAFAADDKPSSWAEESVNKAIAEKLVPQSLQSKYTQATTRAEFCALAVALYENIKGTITGRTTFTDTKDVNVEKMASIGVVSGIGNNKFDPDAKLTREQAAVMLSRLAEAVGKPFEKKAAAFADNGKVSSWALEGVGQVQAAGIMGGVGNNTFAPQDPYTREQSIITIMRTYDAVKGDGTTEPTKPTDPPSGSIDSKIIGHWRFRSIQGGGTWYRYHDYTFNADGTFLYAYTSDSRSNQITYTEGKYTTSNGKVYMTDVIYERGESYESRYDDRVHEYEFGTNVYGVCLKIGNMNLTDEAGKYVNMSLAVEFNKYSDIYGKNGTETTEPTKPTDPPTSGNIDAKLVGKWVFMSEYYYYFLDDGVFKYLVSGATGMFSIYEGKYTTSNGKIYLTDIVNINFENTKYFDQTLEYSFGTDSEGEYLLIPEYEPLTAEYDGGKTISKWSPQKFYKDKAYVQ